LLEQIKKAERRAEELLAEAVVYRKLLENCYRGARKATEYNNPSFLRSEMQLNAFHMPFEFDVKKWGRDFLDVCRGKDEWLEATKESLKKIQTAAEKLVVEDGTENAELKKQILYASREGLVSN
jgi:hypothetical protein